MYQNQSGASETFEDRIKASNIRGVTDKSVRKYEKTLEQDIRDIGIRQL